MFSVEVLLLVIFQLMALGLIALGVPLLKHRVAPNRFYGIRTAKTLADPRAWYAANRVAGFCQIVAGLATAAVSCIAFAVGAELGWQCFLTLATVLIGVIVMAVLSDQAAREPETSFLIRPRIQFRLLALFTLTTVVAMGSAIARLPVPGLLRLTMSTLR